MKRRHKHIDMTGNCAYFSHSAQFTQHAHEYLNPAIEPGFLFRVFEKYLVAGS